MLLRTKHWPDAHPCPAHVDERIGDNALIENRGDVIARTPPLWIWPFQTIRHILSQ